MILDICMLGPPISSGVSGGSGGVALLEESRQWREALGDTSGYSQCALSVSCLVKMQALSLCCNCHACCLLPHPLPSQIHFPLELQAKYTFPL